MQRLVSIVVFMVYVLLQQMMGGIKMKVDERIKMIWLESSGTGNTRSLEDWLNEMERIF